MVLCYGESVVPRLMPSVQQLKNWCVGLGLLSLVSVFGCGGVAPSETGAKVYQANPSNYQRLLRHLRPGDTLSLAPGIYESRRSSPGLPLFRVHGTPDAPIVISGPESGPPAVLIGQSSHNTIRFSNASYLTIRNLEIDGRNRGGDGIKAQGIAHHITIENVKIRGVGNEQGTVGISTNGGTTWHWVIRNCVIQGAGTGMYLGNSDGKEPFIAGLIEHNLIIDTIGYNIEIKHQNPRPRVPGIPTGRSQTIIRHNVFSKGANSSTGSRARPNLLVGHFPRSGPGQDDLYEIYGNFFYQNPSGERLFQGEGNIALHHNLFVNTTGDALSIQPHNYIPRMVQVFQNTVVAKKRGISITEGSPQFRQRAFGNMVFSDLPIRAEDQSDNMTGKYGDASTTLVNPFGKVGELDLYPQANLRDQVKKANVVAGESFTDAQVDFNGSRMAPGMVGAYAGWGANPGWLPNLERKPPMPQAHSPGAPVGLTVH